MNYLFVKRMLDFFLSFAALIVFSPIFLFLCIIIKSSSPGPVFFKQKRVGKNKRLFFMYKFRTMRVDTPKDMPTHLLNNPESYITPIGRFLRKSSLDELPQLLNIIIGDMSIIGPRPALWNQFDLIEERELLNANSVAPGLTGWAQINGRDELEIPIKAQLDGEYVRNLSLKFDLKVFILTFLVVLRAQGVKEGSNNRIGAESKESIGR